MWVVSMRSLLASKFRFAATAFAVVLGVAFLTGSLVLADTIERTLDELVADVNAGVDVTVRSGESIESEIGDIRRRIDASALEVVRGVDSVAAAEGFSIGYAQPLDRDGNPMGQFAVGSSWMTTPELNPYSLVVGRAVDGLRCAIGMQRALAARNAEADEPIRVRIGLHTGEAIRTLPFTSGRRGPARKRRPPHGRQDRVGMVDGDRGAPQVISHYRLDEEIGRGGMGAVYRATDLRDGSVVAVMLRSELSEDPSYRVRFQREAHVAALLRSPYTVHLIDYGLEGGRYFLAMDFVEGRSLREELRDGPLDVLRALQVAETVARALEEAEARGVVHRDIKPDNIMLRAAGGHADADRRRRLRGIVPVCVARTGRGRRRPSIGHLFLGRHALPGAERGAAVQRDRAGTD